MSVSVYRKTDQTKLVVVRPALSYADSQGPVGPPGIFGAQGTRGTPGSTGAVGTISNYLTTFVTSGSWAAPTANPFTVSLGTDVDVNFPSSSIRPWLRGTMAGYHSIIVKASATLAKTGATSIGPDCQLRFTLYTNGTEPLASVQHAWATSANSSEGLNLSFSCAAYLEPNGVDGDRFKVTLTREGPSAFTMTVNWVAVMLHPMGTFGTGPAGLRGTTGNRGIQGIRGAQGYRGAPSEGYTTYNQIPTP